MNKIFIGAFLAVFSLYVFVVSKVRYTGVYVHYVGIPLILILLLLSFITRPGLFSRKQRIERALGDENYNSFDFIRDCWRVTISILKFPFKVITFVSDDYKEYKANEKHDQQKNK